MEMKNCKYCYGALDRLNAEWLKCKKCEHCIHTTCLHRKTTPGGIYGDIFYQYTCSDCTESQSEVFVREKMSWFQVMVLVMYHLQHKTPGTAKKGFFHWRVHLVSFIDRNWDLLFRKDFKRRKNWTGTISGSLSHYSPYFVTSGAKELGESGWWRLTFPKLTPSLMSSIYSELVASKQINIKQSKNADSTTVLFHVKMLIDKYASAALTADAWNNDNRNNIIHVTKFKPKTLEDEMMILDNVVDDQLEFDILDTETTDSQNLLNGLNIFQHQNEYHVCDVLQNFNISANKLEQKIEKPKKLSEPKKLTPSLFHKSTRSKFYEFWNKLETNKKKVTFSSELCALKRLEEAFLLQYVKHGSNRETRALTRKLILQSQKRKNNLKLFDIDQIMNKRPQCNTLNDKKNRFCHFTVNEDQLINKQEILIASGQDGMRSIVSPYTGRVLKPFIRRDAETTPIWLKITSELYTRTRAKGITDPIPTRSYIDYCYLKPNHIAAINCLCETYFWPGIDMSEALEYPEFTCVVLYRKLVIGFAFMVPDVKFNEAYITFIFVRPKWRGAGIGTFMMYHLIQSCMGKDITLHVAIDNPAIFLYQKFGFKVEEVVSNFYDCYIRDDSKMCKHAFFLRLQR